MPTLFLYPTFTIRGRCSRIVMIKIVILDRPVSAYANVNESPQSPKDHILKLSKRLE